MLFFKKKMDNCCDIEIKEVEENKESKCCDGNTECC